MADKRQNITQFRRGEYVRFPFDSVGIDGVEPSELTLVMTISDEENGEPITQYNQDRHFSKIEDGKWEVTLTADDLVPLDDLRLYYFNVWGFLPDDEPIVQREGVMRLRPSIYPVTTGIIPEDEEDQPGTQIPALQAPVIVPGDGSATVSE